MDITQRNQRGRRTHHNARALERNQGQKQTDTGRNRQLERMRDGVDQGFSHLEQAHHHKNHARNKHRAQRDLPSTFMPMHTEKVK